MFLIVGLGNPGERYIQTRHNIGFQILTNFAQKHSFPEWRFDKKAEAFTTETIWNHEDLMLVKPQTMMNNSGKAVKILFRKQKIKDWILNQEYSERFKGKHFQNVQGVFVNPFDLIANPRKNPTQSFSAWRSERSKRYMLVIHDDIDLLLGKIKISLGNSSGGHRGVESIIKETGTKEFARIRIGIQPPDGKPDTVEEFVIKKFAPNEKQIVDKVVFNAQNALETIITEGIQKAMNEYN